MNIIKHLMLVFSLLITGCATVGPTIVIETDEPAEDFVVLCNKTKSHLFKIGHGGREVVTDHVIVTESGKEVSCGLMVGGSDGYVSTMHPTLTGDSTQNYEKDGVRHIVYNKTKLDLLDEQKAKFEAGYWDKTRNPAWEYLGSRPGCGFPHQYFEYYKQAKRVKVEHFKNRYQKPILECAKKAYIDTKKYKPHLAKKIPEPTTRINQLWESIKEYEKDD